MLFFQIFQRPIEGIIWGLLWEEIESLGKKSSSATLNCIDSREDHLVILLITANVTVIFNNKANIDTLGVKPATKLGHSALYSVASS